MAENPIYTVCRPYVRVAFTSCHITFVAAACTHYYVAHCPKAVVLLPSQRHLQFYIVLCLPAPHFMNNIMMRVMRTMGFTVWSIALLMNQDESMLCDLERKGKTTVLEGVIRIVCVIVVAFQRVSHCLC